jgi:hypothetical protein
LAQSVEHQSTCKGRGKPVDRIWVEDLASAMHTMMKA